MNINMERLAIPDTIYDAIVTMNANEFRKIVTDLLTMGDSRKHFNPRNPSLVLF
jgi:hypothetical protein